MATGAGTVASTKTSQGIEPNASAPTGGGVAIADTTTGVVDDELSGAAGGDVDREDLIRLNIRVPRECDGWRLDHFLKRRIGRLATTSLPDAGGCRVCRKDRGPGGESRL